MPSQKFRLERRDIDFWKNNWDSSLIWEIHHLNLGNLREEIRCCSNLWICCYAKSQTSVLGFQSLLQFSDFFCGLSSHSRAIGIFTVVHSTFQFIFTSVRSDSTSVSKIACKIEIWVVCYAVAREMFQWDLLEKFTSSLTFLTGGLNFCEHNL